MSRRGIHERRRLLSLLLERRPRALSRAEIRDVVWPRTFVSESTLAVVVNGIRQALGDDARHPRFIRTVHGFGYAFCGEAREAAEGQPQVSEAVEERPYPGLLVFRCGEQEVLRPVFKDLTPLYPPSPAALRRALVEPAAGRGVRFEDDALADEMVEAVASERGALPLLAFAVSRLWEERDRSRRLMTREAYGRMDGVAGALAQHAEAALSQLGPEREGMVREILRNLVTAQGTRAAADRAELLSVFGERREEAGAVLDALVDARLLTEYEPAETQAPSVTHRRIEIVHESLLTHWPRLVRWRTQDADGAQLRDQLRQTAHLWDERGRPDDLLWTGTSYLDYGARRARYSGGLSAIEEAFAQAMAALANRRRRRRRIAFAAVVAALAIGLGVVAMLWSRSEAARRRADAEALRAEAGKLLALGQAELERYPTAALAYATKSLKLADTEEARLFALRVLQEGPTALLALAHERDGLDPASVAFDSTGEWLAVGGSRKVQLRHRDGREPIVMEGELVGGEPRLVGTMEGHPWGDIDEAGVQVAYSPGRSIHVRSLENWASPPRLVATHPADVRGIAFHPDGRRFAAVDMSGSIRIWPTAARSEQPRRRLRAVRPLGRHGQQPGACPLASSKALPSLGGAPTSGRWTTWCSRRTGPRSCPPRAGKTARCAWSLSVESVIGGRILLEEGLDGPRVAVDPRAERVAVSAHSGHVVVVPVAGERCAGSRASPRVLSGASSRSRQTDVASPRRPSRSRRKTR